MDNKAMRKGRVFRQDFHHPETIILCVLIVVKEEKK